MDLTFTPEELKFRADIRAWVAQSLPASISHAPQRFQFVGVVGKQHQRCQAGQMLILSHNGKIYGNAWEADLK